MKKTLFKTKTIRALDTNELYYLNETEKVLTYNTLSAIIGRLPAIVSNDKISRPLILNKETVLKISKKHGTINPINLIINANNWDVAIKNIDNTIDKVCLIKYIPDSNNLLIIGAFRKNGCYILTHYEVEVTKDNQLKSLLGRGDLIRKDA